MSPPVRMGLIVGVVGLVINICVSAAMGLCGPVVSMIAGGIAAYLAIGQAKPLTKDASLRTGASAAAIAGSLILIGQLIGGILALVLIQQSGTSTGIGTIPSPSGSADMQLVYYLSGLGVGVCFGIIGVGLASLVGAGVGYVRAPAAGTQPPTTPNG